MVDEDFAWRLAQELVRIESSDPGAYEDEIERFIKRLIEQQLAQLDSSALDAVQIEELEVLPGRRNLKVTVPGQSDEPRLIYICHMDTVTLGDGWDADIAPLGAVVRDDKLYGRGACDMKGGLACAIAALVHTLERVAADGALPRRGFSLICSVDEEDFMRGSEAAIDAGWVGSREWVLDTEPTDGQIQVAHKGRTWFEIEMAGVTAHASQPGRARMPSPPWPRSCVRFVARLRRCPRTMSWGLRPSRLAKSRADIAPTSYPTAPKFGSTCA